MLDLWGEPVMGSDPISLTAWNDAWIETLHFVGDPFAQLAEANESDESFALGSIFCGAYRVLGGLPAQSVEVQADLARSAGRAASPREQAHVEALQLLCAGNFTAAALRWDQAALGHHDLAAVRFAHDVYLHVGDAEGRLRSNEAAFAAWGAADPGWGFIAGQRSFALEEMGRFAEAETIGWESLDADPLDLWALHALAHVYESTDDSDAALSLLRSRQDTWRTQDALAVHIWWHLALRLIATGSLDEALHLHDQLVPDAGTSFRLCDLASILWRLEIAGVDVGERWEHLANAFAVRPERHTSGFLDMHAAMVYTRQPNHPEADRFFQGLDALQLDNSENAATFAAVVRPLVEAVRNCDVDPQRSVEVFDQLNPQLHRIGGSIAQRDIIPLTREHLTSQSPETP